MLVMIREPDSGGEGNVRHDWSWFCGGGDCGDASV